MKEFRLETGMNQEQFAEYFGIPIRTLQEWEQGRRKPAPYIIELMKRIWNIENHYDNKYCKKIETDDSKNE